MIVLGDPSETKFLETTIPSDYVTEATDWCCTLGASECENLALALTRYLRAHGDEWATVPWDALEEHFWANGGGVQLRYPSGRRRAAGFDHSDEELMCFLGRGLRPASMFAESRGSSRW